MATEKQTSNKVFGGNSLPSGVYEINRAFIGEDILKIAGQPDAPYDTLEIEVKIVGDNGQVGNIAAATLRLNGVWRARRDADGKKVQASGSLFEGLIKTCQGKSFTETRDFINAQLKGKQFRLDYEEYPSASGGFGRVPKANMVTANQAAPATSVF